MVLKIELPRPIHSKKIVKDPTSGTIGASLTVLKRNWRDSRFKEYRSSLFTRLRVTKPPSKEPKLAYTNTHWNKFVWESSKKCEGKSPGDANFLLQSHIDGPRIPIALSKIVERNPRSGAKQFRFRLANNKPMRQIRHSIKLDKIEPSDCKGRYD